MGDQCYEDRLQKINFLSLVKRCLKGDMIALYTCINGNFIIRNKLLNMRTLKETLANNMRLNEK